MSKINTGKYRICKNQIGIGGTIETLSEHKSKEDLKEAFERIEKKRNGITTVKKRLYTKERF